MWIIGTFTYISEALGEGLGMRWAMRMGNLWLRCSRAAFFILHIITLRVAAGRQMVLVVASVRATVSHFGVLSDLCSVM